MHFFGKLISPFEKGLPRAPKWLKPRNFGFVDPLDTMPWGAMYVFLYVNLDFQTWKVLELLLEKSWKVLEFIKLKKNTNIKFSAVTTKFWKFSWLHRAVWSHCGV